MNMYPTGAAGYPRYVFQLETLPVRIGALPAKVFQDAVNEFMIARECPVELGYVAALGALSIAMQNLLDVETPNGHRFPPSLLAVGVGGPTAGKSAAGKYFLQCIEDFDLFNSYRLPGGGFLYEDTTGPALFAGLEQFPTAGIYSCEGSSILKNILRKEASRVNALWSGESIKIRRRTAKSFTLINARLTVLALVHPGRLQEFLSVSGVELTDVGLLARLFVAQAEDVLYPGSSDPIPEPCREAFSNRIRELLEQNVDAASDHQFERKVMRFNLQASRIWHEYCAQLKIDARPGGRYELAPEHAGRLAQNVARVAALLHYFEEIEGEMDENSLYAAIALCEASSRHFMRLFVPQISEELDADVLDHWITYRRRERNPGAQGITGRAELRRGAPNRMRDNAIFNPLIDILIGRGRIVQFKKNGAWHLDLTPWLRTWPSPTQAIQVKTGP